MGNAGRVLMIPKGDYNPATPYEMLDCVYYNGRSYVCKERSTGNLPTNTTYWQAMTPDSSTEIQALTNYDANNGVKNIWNINAIGTENQSGITYTPSEGVLKLTGTALNASVWPTTVTSAEKSYILKPSTTYKISVGVTFSNSIKLRIYVKATESSAWDNVLTADSGTEATYTTPATWAQIWIRVEIASGYTLPATLYPMIRDASIADATYQPYAKTNVELTNLIKYGEVSGTLSDSKYSEFYYTTVDINLPAGAVIISAIPVMSYGNNFVHAQYLIDGGVNKLRVYGTNSGGTFTIRYAYLT